jgi:hypothetical protein
MMAAIFTESTSDLNGQIARQPFDEQVSGRVSACQGMPNGLGFMKQECHRVSASVREYLREGVN